MSQEKPIDAVTFIGEANIQYNRNIDDNILSITSFMLPSYTAVGKEEIREVTHSTLNLNQLNARRRTLLDEQKIKLDALEAEYPLTEEQKCQYNIKRDRIISIGCGINPHLYDCFEMINKQREFVYRRYILFPDWNFKFTIKKENVDKHIEIEMKKVGDSIHERLRDEDICTDSEIGVNIDRDLTDNDTLYTYSISICL
jgi:hypothetical protein